MKKLVLAIAFLSATTLMMAQSTAVATKVTTTVPVTTTTATFSQNQLPQKAAVVKNSGGGEVQVGAGTPRGGVGVGPRPKKPTDIPVGAPAVQQVKAVRQ